MLPITRRVSSKFFSNKKVVVKRKNSLLFNVVFYKKEKEEGFDRFAVVISKKISKKATKRNYIRRVVYSILKEIVTDDVWKEHNNYIIIFVKEDISTLNYQDIKKELKKLILE